MSSTEIGNVSGIVSETLKKSEKFLLLISPFIKESALSTLVENLNRTPDKMIVVARWLPEDLLSGVSDISVYELVKQFGGRMYVHEKIHLKVYVSDYEHALIGSANLTNKGLGLIENHNIEALTKIDCDENFLSDINHIIDESIELTDYLVATYKEMVDKFQAEYKQQKIEGLDDCYAQIKAKLKLSKRGGLFVHDFPLVSNPEEYLKLSSRKDSNHLLAFGVIKDISELQSHFLNSKAYIWQKTNITETVLFGRYSQLLHNALNDIPTPYRKSVKELVENMFNWTEYFSDEYRIKKHNYTKSLIKI